MIDNFFSVTKICTYRTLLTYSQYIVFYQTFFNQIFKCYILRDNNKIK